MNMKATSLAFAIVILIVILGMGFAYTAYMKASPINTDPRGRIHTTDKPSEHEKGQLNTAPHLSEPSTHYLGALHAISAAQTKSGLHEQKSKLEDYRKAIVSAGDESLSDLEILARNESGTVRAKAVGMMHAIGTEKSAEALLRHTDTAEGSTRLYAIQQLLDLLPTAQFPKHSFSEAAVPALLACLDDPDASIRATAHKALFRLTRCPVDYVPSWPPDKRQPAIANIQSWWEKTAQARAETISRRSNGGGTHDE